MKEKQIKINSNPGYFTEWEWEGSIKEAMEIALQEISDNAKIHGNSKAYRFTKTIFNEFKKGMK
ncbi:MAG: hypothetical protein JRI26_10605 [Deltaproteobacteria bacterium]|nr:hypothetical protein [Deltaproteobacteria bacterium]